MKLVVVTRAKRLIKKQFGNYKNFIVWCFAVTIAVYAVDSLITSRIHSRPRKASRELGLPTLSSVAMTLDENRNTQAVEVVAKARPLYCGLINRCPKGKYSYYIRSGYDRDISATICFNELYIIAEDKVKSDRGLNIVVVNDVSLNVEEIKSFDVFVSDAALKVYLKSIRNNFLIFVTSQDEASFNMSRYTRQLFHEFGSSVLDRVNFRDNYALIGQKGIPLGHAIEGIESRKENRQFAESAIISGCLTIPVGKDREKDKSAPAAPQEKKPSVVANKQKRVNEDLKPIKAADRPKAEVKVPPVPAKQEVKASEKPKPGKNKTVEEKKTELTKKSNFKLGEELHNCGVKGDCKDGGIPVHLFTGLKSQELPKICVDGIYMMAKGLNDAGRGLNFVVFNPKTRTVVRVARFDTYSTDDNMIELFLDMLQDGEILLCVAHDDASVNLQKSTLELLKSYGSSYIDRLSLRDVWAFVTQKGMSGFSPLEEVEFSEASIELMMLSWPNPIDLRLCVPRKLTGFTSPKPVKRNSLRRAFCKKHNEFGTFCSKENIDLPLIPKPLGQKELENDVIYTVPIAIITGGLEYEGVRQQLENLFANPGVQPKMITVFYDEKFQLAADVAIVYGVKSQKLQSSVKYTELFEKAISASWKTFPNTKYMIILEEEVFPSTDFLNFFRQCIPTLADDETLAGVSAWNDNGYTEKSALLHMAYRAETLPGFGFLLKRSFYKEQLKPRMTSCCSRRAWEGWILDPKGPQFEMIIPDTSRVAHGPYKGSQTDLTSEMFSRSRHMVGFGGNQYHIENTFSLEKNNYETILNQIIPDASQMNQADLQRCLGNSNFVFPSKKLHDGPYAVYFEQESVFDHKILSLLCKCFNLFYVAGQRSRSTHNGMIRFSFNDEQIVFLIGSKTSYYRHKPDDVTPLRMSPTNA